MNNLNDAVKLCKALYVELSPHYYPALTGGSLYKNGDRKDIDIIIYRNRETLPFEIYEIQNNLEDAGLYNFIHHGFVTKCEFDGLSVDLMNPETTSGTDYVCGDDAREMVDILCLTTPLIPTQNKRDSK